MTANWFEAKVKYVKVGEDGKEKKMSELYLLDAVLHGGGEPDHGKSAGDDSGRFLYRGVEEIEHHGVGGVE